MPDQTTLNPFTVQLSASEAERFGFLAPEGQVGSELELNANDLELIDLLDSIHGQEHLLEVEQALLAALPAGKIKDYYTALIQYDLLKAEYYRAINANKDQLELKNLLEVYQVQLKNLQLDFAKIFTSNNTATENTLGMLLELKYQTANILTADHQLSFQPQQPFASAAEKLRILAEKGVGFAIPFAVAEELEEKVQRQLWETGADHGHARSQIELACLYLSHIANNMGNPSAQQFAFLKLTTGIFAEDHMIQVLMQGLQNSDPIAISKVAQFIDNILGASPALYQDITTEDQRTAMLKAIAIAQKISLDEKIIAYFQAILALANSSQNPEEKVKAAKKISKQAKLYISGELKDEKQQTQPGYTEQFVWTTEKMLPHLAQFSAPNLRAETEHYLEQENLIHNTNQIITLTAQTFNEALVQEIKTLAETDPNPYSRAGKQLAVLQAAQLALKISPDDSSILANKNFTTSKKLECLATKATAIKTVAENLRVQFDKHGYPGQMQKVLDVIIDGLSTLCNRIFKTKFKVSRAIEQSRFAHLMKFSTPTKSAEIRLDSTSSLTQQHTTEQTTPKPKSN